MAQINTGGSYIYEISLNGTDFEEIKLKSVDITPEVGTSEWIPANSNGFKRKIVTSKGFTMACELVVDKSEPIVQKLIELIFSQNIQKHNNIKLKFSAPLEESQTTPESYEYSGSIEPTGGPIIAIDTEDTLKFNFLIDGAPVYTKGS